MEDNNAPKLDWMYAGAAGHVDTEEYLTGRAVDKTFEQFKLGGAEPIGLDLPAHTLPRQKSTVPRIQVDVARKVQEDPLLRIRRQEEERKAMLREQMLIQQRLAPQNKKPPQEQPKDHHHKLKKKKKKKHSSDSSSESDLDSKLAKKLKQFKKPEKGDSLDEQIVKKLQKLKRKKQESSSSSSSASESDDTKKQKTGTHSPHAQKDHRVSERNSSRYQHYAPDNSRDVGRAHRSSDSRRRSRSRDRSSRRSRSRSRDLDRKPREFEKRKETRIPPNRSRAEGPPMANKRSVGARMSEEELEKRRREMMQQAVVRDHERKVKVDMYRKEVEDEAGQLNANRPKEAAFVKKQLASATANSTVEARIKANVFNIQRSVNSMDSNFARR